MMMTTTAITTTATMTANRSGIGKPFLLSFAASSWSATGFFVVVDSSCCSVVVLSSTGVSVMASVSVTVSTILSARKKQTRKEQ